MSDDTITVPAWPDKMPLLDETEVEHGTYRTLYENGLSCHEEKHAEPNYCGTTHCAVGHVAEAFGIDPRPHTPNGWGQGRAGLSGVAPIGSPMHRFTRRFAKNLGADMYKFDDAYARRGLTALEGVFEEGAFRKGVPTEAETAAAFNKAVRESGYTKVVDR